MSIVIQVEKHPAVTHDTKARAEELRMELETQLTLTQIEMAQARASKKHLKRSWKNSSDNKNI